jgi:hypothetical protein
VAAAPPGAEGGTGQPPGSIWRCTGRWRHAIYSTPSTPRDDPFGPGLGAVRPQAGGRVVARRLGHQEPSTKAALAVLGNVGAEGRVLVVLTRDEADVATWKSLRNVPEVHVLTVGELNAYDVLVSDWVIFTRESLPGAKPAETADDGSDK